MAINKLLTGEEGCVMAFPTIIKETIIQKLEDAQKQHLLVKIESHTREVLRIESGIPSYGIDMDEKNILP